MIDVDPQQAIQIAVPALVETIPTLRAEVEALRLENDRLKIERDKLAGDLKWTAYELDQCRHRARLYHNALADVMGAEDAAAVAVLNEGEG